eukprot:s1427_g1.t4
MYIRILCLIGGETCNFKHVTDDRPVCRHFLQGKCTYGDVCGFSHQGDQGTKPALHAVTPSDDRSICRHFLEKKCTFGDLCRFSHEVTSGLTSSNHEDDRHGEIVDRFQMLFVAMSKSTCRHFLEGKCNFGDFCRFSHEVLPPAKAVPQDSTMRGDDRPTCRHFLEGKCNYGDQCHFGHEILPPVSLAVPQDSTMRGDDRSICRHFLEGKCYFGDLCRFGHEEVPSVKAVPQGQESSLAGTGQDDRPTCRHFLEGKCNYGDQCRFGHEALPSVSFSVPQGAPSNLDDRSQCRHFVEGRCTYGDLCRFRHGGESRAARTLPAAFAAPALPAAFAAKHRAAPAPMRPAQPVDDRPICRHFLESQCTYGDRCRFSHTVTSPDRGTVELLGKDDGKKAEGQGVGVPGYGPIRAKQELL